MDCVEEQNPGRASTESLEHAGHNVGVSAQQVEWDTARAQTVHAAPVAAVQLAKHDKPSLGVRLDNIYQRVLFGIRANGLLGLWLIMIMLMSIVLTVFDDSDQLSRLDRGPARRTRIVVHLHPRYEASCTVQMAARQEKRIFQRIHADGAGFFLDRGHAFDQVPEFLLKVSELS